MDKVTETIEQARHEGLSEPQIVARVMALGFSRAAALELVAFALHGPDVVGV